MEETTVTFYVDVGNGKIYAANQPQVNLFKLLNKFKIKSAPSTAMYVLTTGSFMMGGSYTISGQVNVNGSGWQQSSTTFTIPGPTPPKPKLKLVDKNKNFLQPSREDKKKWRQISKTHSRNTGR